MTWNPRTTSNSLKPVVGAKPEKSISSPLGTSGAVSQTKLCAHGKTSVFECTECWNAGVRYDDYLKQKRLNEL